MNKKNAQNLFKLQIFLFFSEALTMYEKNRNIYNLNKFCVFFYSYIYIYIYMSSNNLLDFFYISFLRLLFCKTCDNITNWLIHSKYHLANTHRNTVHFLSFAFVFRTHRIYTLLIHFYVLCNKRHKHIFQL